MQVDQNINQHLVLGTAQLGMMYGIGNMAGQPDIKTVMRIIEYAWNYGIREYDTAQAYGESEKVLGQAFVDLGISNQARIITKLSPKLNYQNGMSLRIALEMSMERLHITTLHGLLLHREDWIDNLAGSLGDSLKEFVHQGTVRHLGVSLYSPIKALQTLESQMFDMIQVPANMLDRRFADAQVFNLAQERKKQVYIRSVFLQGLLLINLDKLPQHMEFARPVLVEFERFCQKFGITRHRAALLYMKQKYPYAKIIFGAETIEQVKQNIDLWKEILPDIIVKEVDDIFRTVDEKVIDPTKWPM